MKLSNPHTHSVFCDGRDTIEHMARRAFEMGFVSLGFSGHSPWTFSSLGVSEDAYSAEVRRVAALYEGRMKIWLGIEKDYLDCSRGQYDYVLGGVHAAKGLDGAEYAVDHSLELFDELFHKGFGGDARAMAKSYFGRVAEMCEKIHPDIIAHFDLIRKFNEGGRFYDESDTQIEKYAMEALEAACNGHTLLEINTGAMARSWRSVPYLTEPLLRHWRELGGRVILGSDCHDAEKLTYGFDAALELARSAGYKTVCRLGTGRDLFEEDVI